MTAIMPQPQASSPNGDFILTIRQEAKHGFVAAKQCNRKPIDPPPVVELKMPPHVKQSDTYIMSCCLLKEGDQDQSPARARDIIFGSTVSSLHQVKDLEKKDVMVFVFNDISVNAVGKYRLHFQAYRLDSDMCQPIASTASQFFQIFAKDSFPGFSESTEWTCSLSDQGVKCKVRLRRRKVHTAGGLLAGPQEEYPGPDTISDDCL